jgi:hypothetical protein|tara:strand:- start:2576 stop:2953 length:378 start_codon:yes stop_codon:yes gene_type:complete
MNKKLIIEDWILYDTEHKGFTSTDAKTSGEFQDIKTEAKELRVFGTKEQILKESKNYRINESFEYHSFKKGSNVSNYYEGKCWSDDVDSRHPTLKDYNNKFESDFNRYSNLYKLNDNKTLILRTR